MSKQLDGKEREEVMMKGVITSKQTIKIRFSADARSDKKKQVAMNVSKGGADGWEREELLGPRQERQSEPTQSPEKKDLKQ